VYAVVVTPPVAELGASTEQVPVAVALSDMKPAMPLPG